MASLRAVHAEPISIDSKGAPWTFTTRLAFRFSLLYFGPYILTTGVVDDLLPFGLPIPAPGSLPPYGRWFFGRRRISSMPPAK